MPARTRLTSMSARRVVWLAAGLAALSRFPGLAHAPFPDEAGFLYVAQHWHPSADQVYGAYFVDRPPILIGVFRLGDLLGGTPAVRVFAAIACALLVLVAAAVAREVTGNARAAAWTAVATAAVTGSKAIEPINAKGEVLGIPLVVAAIWLALVAVRTRSAWPAFAAGVLAMTAVGMKQNMVSGLVFGAVLLAASTLTGVLDRRTAGRLGAASVAGAALPVLAVIAWAELAGVSLHALWYAVSDFRADAARAMAEQGDPYPGDRSGDVIRRALWGGLAPIAALFILRLRACWRQDRAVTAAAVALLVTDGPLLVLGGSWWRSYLFLLVPGTVVFVSLLLRSGSFGRRGVRLLTVYAACVALVGAASWSRQLVHPTLHDDPWNTGLGIAASAEPGDTIVAPGRPDTTAASGLTGSYPYLWPLIQVTLDPDATLLKETLSGPDAPTWFVVLPPISDLDLLTRTGLQSVIDARYVPRGISCAGTPIYLRKGVQRPAAAPDCDRAGY